MNWTFDRFGTYRPIFIVCACIMVTVLVVFQFILNTAYKRKREVMETQ